MGKSFVIRNQRSLNGETTNAVLVTLKAWQKFVETFEEKYYSYKDTYLEDILRHMTYEERIADVEGFVEKAKPSFHVAQCLHLQRKLEENINYMGLRMLTLKYSYTYIKMLYKRRHSKCNNTYDVGRLQAI